MTTTTTTTSTVGGEYKTIEDERISSSPNTFIDSSEQLSSYNDTPAHEAATHRTAHTSTSSNNNNKPRVRSSSYDSNRSYSGSIGGDAEFGNTETGKLVSFNLNSAAASSGAGGGNKTASTNAPHSSSSSMSKSMSSGRLNSAQQQLQQHPQQQQQHQLQRAARTYKTSASRLYDDDKWFFGSISRNDAEELLKADVNQLGAYLVRNCSTDANSFSLSVRGKQNDIKHYKIYCDTGEFASSSPTTTTTTSGTSYLPTCYYITSRQKFATISELLAFYTRHSGLCAKLDKVCLRSSV